MKYDIDAYDKSYKAIVSSYGKSNPGIIEAASNVVGMSWEGPGYYRLRTIDSVDKASFSSSESLGLIIYGLMLKEGLNISVDNLVKSYNN